MNRGMVEKYADRVYRFMKRMAGEQNALDLTQDVFVRLLKSMPQDHPNQDAYVFSVANSVAMDHFRKRSRERRALLVAAQSAVDADYSNPASAHSDFEQRQSILKAVELLPVEQKQVFLLRQEAGLSFKEIAEITGSPINTVLGRMHYALKNLKKSLPSGVQNERV